MNHPSQNTNRLSVLSSVSQRLLCLTVVAVVSLSASRTVWADQLRAGVAKVDITNRDVPLVNDPLYAKALVIKNDSTTVAIVTLDVVAIAEIGSIKNDYLANVRAEIQKTCGIKPDHVLVNVSHCHGSVCADVEQRTVQAVQAAMKEMVPVQVGSGTGHEDRIMENRRMKLTDGSEVDVRRAYSMPPDVQVAEVGPIDPQIGILRLDKRDGQTLAVVYNFACHPIQGVPSGGNTADMTGFASRVIEDNLSEGTMAFFIQGCGGDINPIMYKAVDHPGDAEPLGNLLGLSTLKALRNIKSKPGARLALINESLALPRADFAERIDALQTEQRRLLNSLRGTNLNLKTFLPLVVKYNVSGDYPAYYTQLYLHQKQMGREHLSRMDAINRANMESYRRNIHIMEQLTRIQVNLALMTKHQRNNIAAGTRVIDVEVVALRIGDFVLATFPGELTVRIGLGIKRRSPHKHTFVAGYTNGYIYYAPTAEQLRNLGAAQEDSECVLAPEWQKIFEAKVADLLKRI